MPPVLTTLVYARQDDRVLLLHRKKEPNLGLWVAPGGKLEPGESPQECAWRELHEETGLSAGKLILKGLITEVSPRPDWQWLLFIYVAEEITGNLVECHEGQLAWVRLDCIPLLPLPEADMIFYPHILNDQQVYQAKSVYDQELKLIRMDEY
jgi:8-oxo-dGTP diphosphatase